MPGIQPIFATPAILFCLMLGACAHPDAHAVREGGAHVAAAGANAGMSAQTDPENYEEQAREGFGTKALSHTDLTKGV